MSTDENIKNTDDRFEESKETGRVEAFSDGVYAIAITLLVLEFKVPQQITPGRDLFYELWKVWPTFASYVISFFTILVTWINHHRLFTYIKRTDTGLLILNGLLLLSVSFVPYPTNLIAGFVGRAGEQEAVIFYDGTFVMLAVFYTALWLWASHNNRLLDHQADPESVKALTRQYIFGPPLYLVALLLATFNIMASLFTVAALAIFFVLPGKSLKILTNLPIQKQNEKS